MKRTTLFYSLLFIACFSINLCNAGSFEKQRGNPEHLEQLRQTGKCNGCNLSGMGVTGAINDYQRKYENARWFQQLFMNKAIQLENATLVCTSFRRANLKDANLKKTNLKNADLSSTSLTDANLTNADLENANLEKADLNTANLKKANLENANLLYINLKHANLENANLRNANLDHSNVEDANFKNAILTGVSLQYLKHAEKAFNLFSEE